MPLPPQPVTSGVLTIDTVELKSPCFRVQNLHELQGSGSVRGSDKVIPGVVGVRSQPRRRTATSRILEMEVAGDFDFTGTPFDDAWEGWESNCNVLVALCDSPGGDGTRSATYLSPSGASSTKAITVIEFIPGALIAEGLTKATLEIVIPGGRF